MLKCHGLVHLILINIGYGFAVYDPQDGLHVTEGHIVPASNPHRKFSRRLKGRQFGEETKNGEIEQTAHYLHCWRILACCMQGYLRYRNMPPAHPPLPGLARADQHGSYGSQFLKVSHSDRLCDQVADPCQQVKPGQLRCPPPGCLIAFVVLDHT